MASTFTGTLASGAVITKADIFTSVLTRLSVLGYNVKSIDIELKAALRDLSARENFLPATTNQATESGTASYTEPTLLKSVNKCWISGAGNLCEGRYEDYLASIEQSSSPATGEPTLWCRWNGSLYFYNPVPDGDDTIVIDYWKFHADDVDTIEFDEVFRTAIVYGVLAELFDGQLASDSQMARFKALYENEINQRKQVSPHENRRVKYRDL